MESTKKIAPPIDVLRRYISETLRHPWLLAGALLGSFGSQAAELARPWFMRGFFNMLANTAHPAPAADFINVIFIITILSLALWAARRLRGWTQVYMEARVMNVLSYQAFSYMLRHSVNFFSSNFAGALTRRISKYKDSYETLYDTLLFTLLPFAIFVTGAVVIVFLRNHTLGIIFGTWTAVAVIFQMKVTAMRQPLRDARAAQDTKVVGIAADAMTNQTTITLFSATTYETGLFQDAMRLWRTKTIRSWIADENIWTIQGLLMIVANIGLLYGTYHYWTLGLVQIGDFVLIQSYLIGTFDQVTNINRDLRRVYDAFADAGEMVAMLDMPHEVADRPDAYSINVSEGEIVFDDIQFHFHESRSVLHNFNLTVAPGEKVALVGSSGAGKSTITKLLLRLYDVQGGRILIDDQVIAEVTQESLRNAIGFVPQEPILFHRSLMENIRYGRRDATDDEVMEAARKAHCHEFIASLPDAYETYVGERGVKLSGGERQRVAIARAILKNASILILDEATSSLDSESESLIQDSLETLMRGKTVLVIAHRLSTIMRMDRIIVLEGGEVKAQGTHAQLLKQGGLYQKLWSIQAGGFLQDEEIEDAE